MPERQTLAQMVRRKYPGAYDDLSDAELSQRIRAKHPGAYDDIPDGAEEAEPSMASRIGQGLVGAAKGYGETMARTMGPIALGPLGILAAGNERGYVKTPKELEPTDDQRTGYAIEKAAEFLAPGGTISRATKGAGLAARAGMEAIVGGGIASQQTKGDPKQTAIAAGLSTVGPLVSKAGELAAPVIRKLAETQYARALNATTKPLKAESKRIVPQLLDRGVRGTLEGLAEQGAAGSAKAGTAIGEAYEGATKAGTTVDTAPILARLDRVKERFLVQAGGGTVAANPGAVAKIEALQDLVGQFGSKAAPDQLHKLRKNIDDIIKAGGGFGGELTPGTTKALQREARTAIQGELNKAVPDVEKLNAEFSLWKGLENVTKATIQRKEGQAGIVEFGLRTAVGGGIGGLLGGGDRDATAVGAALGALTKHPLYRTISAGHKASLAHALSRGDNAQALSIISRLSAGLATNRSSERRP